MAKFSRSNQRLNGLNPLSYIGDNSYQPIEFMTSNRVPTTLDNKNFSLGDLWLVEGNNTPPLAEDVWMLVSLEAGVATWVNFGGGNGVNTLSDTAGTLVYPLVNNIQLVGTAPLTVVSGVNLLTFALDGTVATSYPTDSGTATPAAGILNVLGGTLARDINTSGAGNTIHVDLNNTITLGDLVNVTGAPSLTCTTGDVSIISGNLNLPQTNTSGTLGVINVNGSRFISSVGTFNTFVGENSGNTSLVTGVQNTSLGQNTLTVLTTGINNTIAGNGSCRLLETGSSNSTLGDHSLFNTTSSSNNIAIGERALVDLTTSIGYNVAIGGVLTGGQLLTGAWNLLLGHQAGYLYTTSESYNINLSSAGVTGDNSIMRIGDTTGVGTYALAKVFIQGIRGITTDIADAIPVLIDSAGQLGTVSSSLRYKENVKDMASYSDSLYKLRPVIFNYKKHSAESKSVGLIAEEVHEVMSQLVVYDKEGLPETVRYNDIVPMLLNEIQKLKLRIDMLESK